MKLAKTIPLDLSTRDGAVPLGEAAVAGDAGSRMLIFELLQEGAPWSPPAGTRAALAFRTEHGFEGEYDALEDGADAFSITGNRVTMLLADQIMAKAGTVWLSLILRGPQMEQLSAFPLMMQVSRGLAGAEELPKQVYRIRDLQQINAEFAAVNTRLETAEGELARKGSDIALDAVTGRVRLVSGAQFLGTGLELPTGGGLAFDGGYVDETGYLHYTRSGVELPLEEYTPIYVGKGGGGASGTGSKLTVTMETPAVVTAAEDVEVLELVGVFRSVDAATGAETGNATAQISVGGSVKRTVSLEQGAFRLDIRPWLGAGTNVVALTITDAYGTTATRRCTVTLERLSLGWDLGETEKTEGSLAVSLTPVGNYPKTIHLAVDGAELEPLVVATSGRKTTRTIPVQSHGAHTVTAWAEMEVEGTVMTSRTLTCAVAWVTEQSPVIVCQQVPQELEQYSSVTLLHRIIDPGNSQAQVQYLVNGKLFRQVQADQSQQSWTYRLSAAGDTTLSICCGDARFDAAIRVLPVAEDVEEITDGLALKLDPSAMAELEGWSSGDYSLTLSEGFDLVNGGIRNDDEGICGIRITAGDRMTLNFPLFGGDARKTGMSAKLIYAVRDSSQKHCTAISCMQGGIGLEIQANNVYLRGNQTVCRLSACEEERTELDVRILPDSQEGIIALWEQCSTFSYMKYASDESFRQASPVGITFGCDEADVWLYLARFYPERALNDGELLANFAADGPDAAAVRERQERNDIFDSTGSIDIEKCAARTPECHHIIFSAPRMPAGKKDFVDTDIRHIYQAGGKEHQWTARGQMVTQGTSSVEHVGTAGGNVNFYFPAGITLADGTQVADGYAMHGRENSIPALELCYKKNVSSEEHVVNRLSAEWYQRFQPSVRPARVRDPRVRDCMESAMCAVYFRNTGTEAVQVGPDLVPPGATVFYGLGNLCSNKDSENVFEYDPIVIEVRNNTEPQVRFKSDDLTGSNWDNNFEFRFLDTSRFTEDQAKAKWQRFQSWLHSLDCTAATDAPLAETVTIAGVSYDTDSTAYRKARWDAEAEQVLDLSAITWHHCITLFLLLRDNRAKNMFWSYDPNTDKWSLRFNWDNDTGLCRNNDGYIDIEPGYMDFDPLGSGMVFNGADNVLFVNLRTWSFDRLRADYLDRESKGAWDIDAMYDYVRRSQDAVCEALWIADAQHNAIRVMEDLGSSAYLERATGRLRLHLKKALTFQKVLVDSYFNATAAQSQRASFRGYTPQQWAGVAPNGKTTVTAYTNLYLNVLAGSTPYQVRAAEGEPVQLDISAHLNNTEIYFYHAPWLQSLGDLAGLYLGQFEAGQLIRVRELKIGSQVVGYENTNFTQASFDNCRKLETLDLGGLSNAKRSFDFSRNLYLKELYTRGSGITGLRFASNGRLESAKINAVKSLNMDRLSRLTEFYIPSCQGLTSLRVEDCPGVDTLAMVTEAKNLERIRLTGISWQCADASVLLRLAGCAGLDSEGHDTAQAVVAGQVHIANLTQEELEVIVAAFPELAVRYDSMVPSFTVRFLHPDGRVLDTQRVSQGGNAENPVAAGRIPEPEKASDTEYHYTFAGWDKSLTGITADTDITAVFTPTDRYYRVTFWADAAESRVLETYTVIAHGSVSYSGGEPEGEGIWIGWDADTRDVDRDLDVHPAYLVPELPEVAVEEFDYLCSDDPSDNSAYTISQFAGILQSGQAKTYFQVGDRIRICPVTDAFTDADIVLQVEGFNHFCLADGSGMAGVVFGMVGVMNEKCCMRDAESNLGGWPSADIMGTHLNELIFGGLPLHWQKLIQPVTVLSAAGNATTDIVSTQQRLFLRAYGEIQSITTGPCIHEIDSQAENMTFALYTDNASRIKRLNNGNGDPVGEWWTRSPIANNTQGFYHVAVNGYVASTSHADYRVWKPHYVSWCCCMGGACQ